MGTFLTFFAALVFLLRSSSGWCSTNFSVLKRTRTLVLPLNYRAFSSLIIVRFGDYSDISTLKAGFLTVSHDFKKTSPDTRQLVKHITTVLLCPWLVTSVLNGNTCAECYLLSSSVQMLLWQYNTNLLHLFFTIYFALLQQVPPWLTPACSVHVAHRARKLSLRGLWRIFQALLRWLILAQIFKWTVNISFFSLLLYHTLSLALHMVYLDPDLLGCCILRPNATGQTVVKLLLNFTGH